jgi:hypothetical protein
MSNRIRRELEMLHAVADHTMSDIIVPMAGGGQLLIKIDSFYPFHGPRDVRINGYEYMALLRKRELAIISSELSDLVSGNISYSCPCCDSIVCGNNWTVVSTLKDVKDEVLTMVALQRRVVGRVIARVVIRLFLFPYCPIASYI